MRKANVSLGIATHDVVDLFETQMGMLIMNSCKTWFLLANAEAQTPEVAKAYGRLGCTETETAEIARMRGILRYVKGPGLVGPADEDRSGVGLPQNPRL